VNNKILTKCSFLSLLLVSLPGFSGGSGPFSFNPSLYFGALGGYGSTTWAGLVPVKSRQNSALSMATPIKVSEGGSVAGAFIGYEFVPAFALELTYMDYPNANVFFDPMSLFSFKHDDLEMFRTKTKTVSLLAKVMMPVSNTAFRLYSSVGAAGVQRKDMLINDWRLSPSFGAGLNYRLGKHVMAEIGANYTAGYGESQLSPADSYFPFLYSVVGRLAYRF